MPLHRARFDELAGVLERLAATTAKPIRIFPVGTQGSGKSTLDARLKEALGQLQCIGVRTGTSTYRQTKESSPTA